MMRRIRIMDYYVINGMAESLFVQTLLSLIFEMRSQLCGGNYPIQPYLDGLF